jgi:integrase/recombinase XerD
MDIKLGYDTRPNVDWLTEEEVIRLLRAPMSPLEDMVIHLESQMGLRSVEVIRLRVQDVYLESGYIDIRGKGQGEGKWRRVPIPKGSASVFIRWMETRNGYINNAKRLNPRFKTPDALIVTNRYKHKPVVEGYTEQGGGLDKIVKALCERIGFEFSHHTLRRTFGRMSYRAGASIAAISKILGHEDIVTTLKYVGADMDDMRSAMDIFETHQNALMKGVV